MNTVHSTRRPMTAARQPGERLLLGVGIIGIGLLALLDNLQLFGMPLLRHLWPLGLVLMGISRLAYARHVGGGLLGTGLIVAGVLLTARNLGFADIDLDLRTWWPVPVILAGLSIVFRTSRTGATAAAAHAAGDIRIDAAFSSVQQRHDSPAFHGGRIDATFGSVALDLTQARMAGPEAVLQLSARFSSIELRVPAGWQVVVELQSTLGDTQDRTLAPVNPAHRLLLRGDTLCAGLKIRN